MDWYDIPVITALFLVDTTVGFAPLASPVLLGPLKPPAVFKPPTVLNPPGVFKPPTVLNPPGVFKPPAVLNPPGVFKSPAELSPPPEGLNPPGEPVPLPPKIYIKKGGKCTD